MDDFDNDLKSRHDEAMRSLRAHKLALSLGDKGRLSQSQVQKEIQAVLDYECSITKMGWLARTKRRFELATTYGVA